jgi:hypothetical protein
LPTGEEDGSGSRPEDTIEEDAQMEGALMSLLQAAGLAGASGHRAFIPALALGILHHISAAAAGPGVDPTFALGADFAWLADPVVMSVLGALTLVEILAEMNPDAPELVNLSLKLPKLVSGFVVVAASVGQVSESWTLMAASGVLGAGTALTVDSLRADVKHTVDETLSDASDGHSTKAIGAGESVWAGLLAVGAIVFPIIAAVGLLLLVGIWWGGKRAARAKHVPCPECGAMRHPQASVCPSCKQAITAAS